MSYREIDYPREGYFFEGKMKTGDKFTSDINGCYGFKNHAQAMQAMREFIQENIDDIDYIEGPYIGCYI